MIFPYPREQKTKKKDAEKQSVMLWSIIVIADLPQHEIDLLAKGSCTDDPTASSRCVRIITQLCQPAWTQAFPTHLESDILMKAERGENFFPTPQKKIRAKAQIETCLELSLSPVYLRKLW